MTWGSGLHGGDCSAVRDQLYSVQQIQSSSMAFAALRADGSVLTWGQGANGSDSPAVRDELQEGVLNIYSQYFIGLLAHEFGRVLGLEGFGFGILECSLFGLNVLGVHNTSRTEGFLAKKRTTKALLLLKQVVGLFFGAMVTVLRGA